MSTRHLCVSAATLAAISACGDTELCGDSCGAVTCTIEPLGSLIRTDEAFGPPWSF